MTKKCSSCKEVLDLSSFNKNSKNLKDGRSSWCRACASTKNRERYVNEVGDRRKEQRRERASDPLVQQEKQLRKQARDLQREQRRRERAQDPEFQRKNREQVRAWRLKDPERARAKANKWRRENPDKLRALKRKHYEENIERYKKQSTDRYLRKKDEIKKYLSEWRRKNPDKIRLHNRRKREIKKNAGGRATEEQVANRIAYYGGRCYVCLRKADAVDHVIPLAGGGTCWPANLRPICTPCNSRKGSRVVLRDLPRFVAQARLTESAL